MKLTTTIALSALLLTNNSAAQDATTVDFTINDAFDLGGTIYTDMAIDAEFTERFIRLTGKFYSDNHDDQMYFTGACESITAYLINCDLPLRLYSATLRLSLVSLQGNVAAVGLLTGDQKTSTISAK